MNQRKSNAGSRSLWTASVVAIRAAEYVHLRAAARIARAEYHAQCARFRERHLAGGYIDKEDPAFRRATRKTYVAAQSALANERNALRRLETAARNATPDLRISYPFEGA